MVITRPELVDAISPGKTRVIPFAGSAQGMSASLAFGISHAMDWDGCLVCLADMPFIVSSTYHTLANRLSPDSIVLPVYQGRPGNPAGFGRKFYAQLQNLTGDVGGRAVTAANTDSVVEIAINDPAIHKDIDTPEDLSRLQ